MRGKVEQWDVPYVCLCINWESWCVCSSCSFFISFFFEMEVQANGALKAEDAGFDGLVGPSVLDTEF